jgi:transposase
MMECNKVGGEFFAGCDLHVRSVHVVVKRLDGEVLFSRNLPRDRAIFLGAVAPFRHSLVVACESLHNWPWLACVCEDEGIPFVLADAYQTARTGRRREKNDQAAALHLATLLARNELPTAYVLPRHLRGLRGLNRERIALVRDRVRLVGRLRAVAQEHGHPGRLADLRDLDPEATAAVFPDPRVRMRLHQGLALVGMLEAAIACVGKAVRRGVREHYPDDWRLLGSIPGVGDRVSATVLLEVGDFGRFPTEGEFRGACGLGSPARSSGGRVIGRARGHRNADLRWALGMTAMCAARTCELIAGHLRALTKEHPAQKARAILASQLATAIFGMIRTRRPFDIDLFLRRRKRSSSAV